MFHSLKFYLTHGLPGKKDNQGEGQALYWLLVVLGFPLWFPLWLLYRGCGLAWKYGSKPAYTLSCRCWKSFLALSPTGKATVAGTLLALALLGGILRATGTRPATPGGRPATPGASQR